MTARTYFVGNRIWWAAALFIAPVAGAIAENPLVGIVVLSVLLLPAFVVFDSDRPWWSDDVTSLVKDEDRSRREVHLLTLSAAVGLALGLAVALVLA